MFSFQGTSQLKYPNLRRKLWRRPCSKEEAGSYDSPCEAKVVNGKENRRKAKYQNRNERMETGEQDGESRSRKTEATPERTTVRGKTGRRERKKQKAE